MPSCWIVVRRTKSGENRYRVEYRLGGRESSTRYAGSFARKADAEARKRWVIGEMAAVRVPDLSALDDSPRTPPFHEAGEEWLASRIDVAENTRKRIRNDIARVVRANPQLGRKPLDRWEPEDVVAVILELVARKYSPGTTALTHQTMVSIFKHFRIEPNPARDQIVKLPRRGQVHIPPPLADHVEQVAEVISPVKYVLPLLMLDASGVRVAALLATELGDVDETSRVIRVRVDVNGKQKYQHLRFEEELFDVFLATLPARGQRDPDARAFSGVTEGAFAEAIRNACRATGVPHFAPHALRRRRGSLHYKKTGSLAEVAALLRDSDRVAKDHYVYALTDYREVNPSRALDRVRAELTAVPP
jgi:integrase